MIIGFYKLFLLVGGAIITTQIVTLLTRRENHKVHITIDALDPLSIISFTLFNTTVLSLFALSSKN